MPYFSCLLADSDDFWCGFLHNTKFKAEQCLSRALKRAAWETREVPISFYNDRWRERFGCAPCDIDFDKDGKMKVADGLTHDPDVVKKELGMEVYMYEVMKPSPVKQINTSKTKLAYEWARSNPRRKEAKEYMNLALMYSKRPDPCVLTLVERAADVIYVKFVAGKG